MKEIGGIHIAYRINFIIIIGILLFGGVVVYFSFLGATSTIGTEISKYITKFQNKTEYNFNGLQNLSWGDVNFSTNYGVRLGMYDPEELFSTDKRFAIKVVFGEWNNSEELKTRLSKIDSNATIPIVTLEPHFDYNQPDQDYLDLLPQIIEGEYDEQIIESCRVLDEFGGEVFVRWGHEMDNLIGRYPWETTDPEEYINAYNYFVSKCKSISSNSKYIWSPVGHIESIKYYPGDKNVDYVGITLLNFLDFEKDYYGKVRSFLEMMEEKNPIFSEFDKEVIITEFNVTGNENFRIKWLKDAFANFYKHPKLKFVVFFNSKDVEGVWGEKFKTPDWRLNSTQINKILND